MPTRNPKRSASGRSPSPDSASRQPVTPPLDPVFLALNPNALPAQPRPPAELYA